MNDPVILSVDASCYDSTLTQNCRGRLFLHFQADVVRNAEGGALKTANYRRVGMRFFPGASEKILHRREQETGGPKSLNIESSRTNFFHNKLMLRITYYGIKLTSSLLPEVCVCFPPYSQLQTYCLRNRS